MNDEHSPATGAALQEVKEKFEKWRRTRKSPKPIPKNLWKAAVSLSPHYSINQISKALCLNHTALSNRIKNKGSVPAVKTESAPSFIELDLSRPSSISECIIEMENSAGSKMRMHFKGKTEIDLLELSKAFWRKGA